MDLKKVIAREHSRAQMLKVVDYVGSNPARFKVLVDVFLAGPYRITQRAAWPLSYCVEHVPALITPHLRVILNHLEKPGIHDAVKRNTVRLLQFIEIPKRHQGRVADICFRYLQDTREPVAIRVFSMTVLASIARHNPDLRQELAILIEDQLPYGSPAFTSRGRKVLREMRSKLTMRAVDS
jgi:hypothetical protein